MKLPGTNQQQVEGICELIRGIACNFPVGLPAIRKQLDQVQAQPIPQPKAQAVSVGSSQVWSPPTQTYSSPPEDPEVAEAIAKLTLPTSNQPIEEKRGPGRPKGSKNR